MRYSRRPLALFSFERSLCIFYPISAQGQSASSNTPWRRADESLMRFTLSALKRSYIKMSAAGVNSELIQQNLREVLAAVNKTFDRADPDQKGQEPPRLVAVTKTKPVEAIVACYEAGQRHFGENYSQELIEKANDEVLQQKCPDIRFHFIGTLQSNKINKLLKSVPSLHMIETVSSEKLARQLDQTWGKLERDHKLSVMVQVNTSGEENKSGAEPSQALDLADVIVESCLNLRFRGFMTIGAIAHSVAPSGDGPNPDFVRLQEARSAFCNRKGWHLGAVELSMGMSNDFEEAVKMGSTNVRVGSTIFGSRNYK